ncbi:MAG: hypothetical protein KC503_25780 [Myxococcales bacterium]|nr:hypothetical protein [Myxococcales bacterium]
MQTIIKRSIITALALVGLLGGVAQASPEQVIKAHDKHYLANSKTPFAPKWRLINRDAHQRGSVLTTQSLSTNQHATGVTNRVFFPLAGSYHFNRLSQRAELVVAGWENNAATIKYYQRGTGRLSYLTLPRELTHGGSQSNQALMLQGAGTVGRTLVVAGGSLNGPGSTSIYTTAQKRVFIVDGVTKAHQKLPDMPYPAVSPVVGGAGRYILVAGGIGNDKSYTASKRVQVFDRSKKCEGGKRGAWLSDAEIDAKFPGLKEMPTARFGGSVVFAEDKVKGKRYLVFAGGAEQPFGSDPTLSPPTAKVDIYDVTRGCWLPSTKLNNPRMHPGVAVRHTKEGPEIVVAGGGTGPTGSAQRIDPQISAVEIYRLRKGAWYEGDNLPAQKAIMTRHHQGSPSAWQEWGGNVLAFINETNITRIKRILEQTLSAELTTITERNGQPTSIKHVAAQLSKKTVSCQTVRELASEHCVLAGFNTSFFGDLRDPTSAMIAPLTANGGK